MMESQLRPIRELDKGSHFWEPQKNELWLIGDSYAIEAFKCDRETGRIYWERSQDFDSDELVLPCPMHGAIWLRVKPCFEPGCILSLKYDEWVAIKEVDNAAEEISGYYIDFLTGNVLFDHFYRQGWDDAMPSPAGLNIKFLHPFSR